MRHVVEVALWVWCVEVDRWWHGARLDRLDGGESGNGARATQEVADHALWGADRNLVGVITKRALDRLRFGEVVEWGARAVRHDVADVVDDGATIEDRLRHGASSPAASWLRGADVEGVGGCAGTEQLGANGCATCLGMGERLDHEDRATLAEDEAVAVLVERSAGMRWVIVALAEGTHVAEGGEGHRQEWCLDAAGNDHVGLAAADQAERILKGEHARGAGGGLGDGGAGEAVLHADHAGAHARAEGRNGEGAHEAATLLAIGVAPHGDLLDATTAGVDHRGDAVAALRLPAGDVGESGMFDGFGGGGDRELHEAAHATRHLHVHGEERIEALHLGGDAHLIR